MLWIVACLSTFLGEWSNGIARYTQNWKVRVQLLGFGTQPRYEAPVKLRVVKI